MLLQHDGYITWAILHGSVLFGTKANDKVPADARLIDGYPVDSRFYVSGTGAIYSLPHRRRQT
eukprot:scaffold15645_cov98-Skeletonema_dohrnii-CCMP3373.AAC.1